MLWLKNTTAGQMKFLQNRFCQLPFGLKSSPAILNAALQKHLDKYKTSERGVYQLLPLLFYMDDFVCGITSDDEGIQMYKAANRILRKWHIN